MAISAVPAIIDALVTQATSALPNVGVYDGYGVTEDPGNFLLIGVEDPDVDGFETTADTTQEWAHANYTARDERGEVRCAALSWSGGTDAKAVRDSAYATANAVATFLRSTPDLGLVPGTLSLLVTGYGARSQLMQIQDENGATALLAFTVTFRARV